MKYEKVETGFAVAGGPGDGQKDCIVGGSVKAADKGHRCPGIEFGLF